MEDNGVIMDLPNGDPASTSPGAAGYSEDWGGCDCVGVGIAALFDGHGGSFTHCFFTYINPIPPR